MFIKPEIMKVLVAPVGSFGLCLHHQCPGVAWPCWFPADRSAAWCVGPSSGSRPPALVLVPSAAVHHLWNLEPPPIKAILSVQWLSGCFGLCVYNPPGSSAPQVKGIWGMCAGVALTWVAVLPFYMPVCSGALWSPPAVGIFSVRMLPIRGTKRLENWPHSTR